jgi:hypothetical protein
MPITIALRQDDLKFQAEKNERGYTFLAEQW